MEMALALPMQPDEPTLMERARDGDPTAFGQLVSRHMRQAYQAALGLVGSHDDALDLSQEAFVRAFRAHATLDPTRSFYPWLYTILRRLCFNFLRDRKSRAQKMEAHGGWLVDAATSRAHNLGPAEIVERRERRERVEAALATLADHHREVLVMKEFEGLRYREIAELLDIPIGTVMSRLYAARRQLAPRLKDWDA